MIDAKDEGTDSVSDIKGLKVFDVETWEDLESAYWWLHANPKAYKTVVIDTITQMQNILVQEIGAGKNLRGKNAGDWGVLTQKDWGTIAGKLKKLITDFRDLPMEIVFIAQARTFNLDSEEDEGVLDPEVGPALSPSVNSHLCAAVSVIANTLVRSRMVKKKIGKKTIERRVVEYCLRLGPSETYITKFRKPKGIDLPEFVVDPTYDEILELIHGE